MIDQTHHSPLLLDIDRLDQEERDIKRVRFACDWLLRWPRAEPGVRAGWAEDAAEALARLAARERLRGKRD